MMGFGIAAVSTVACEAPVKYAIPYVDKPVDVDPSIANYYASTYSMGSDYCSVVVKTREGRPIKIDGNKFSKVSAGSTSTQVESSVLTLYDKQRLQAPMLSNKESSWNEVDKFVKNTMSSLSKKSYIISSSISSPSSLDVIDKFCDKYNAEHVQYDNVSYNGMLDANLEHYGKRKLPFYDFSKANVVVSFGYDFLGSSFNHNLFNKQFADRRKVDRDNREMSRLYSFESNLSLTGANSDNRIPIESNHSSLYITELWNILSQKTGKNIFAKYRPPLISYDKSKKKKIIEIEDNGIGMSKSVQSKAAQPPCAEESRLACNQISTFIFGLSHTTHQLCFKQYKICHPSDHHIQSDFKPQFHIPQADTHKLKKVQEKLMLQG